MKTNILKRLFAVSLTLLALACSDNMVKTPDPQVTVKLPEFVAPDGIVFNGDYLIIPTPDLYKQTIALLKSSDPASVAKWTSNIGFLSMRQIYSRALQEQEDHPNQQTEFVATHSALFDFDDDGSIKRLKLSNPLMDPLLNKDGIIMVAGHIFQYNENNVKIIVGGDNSKIALLPKIETTDEKLNIVVNPVTTEYKTKTDVNGRLTHSYGSSYYVGISGGNTYYFNYGVYISTRLDPVYDTTPVCDPPGCGQARSSKAQDCYCYYPIVNYTRYVLHYATMEARKSGFGDSQHRSDTNEIYATVTDTNGTHNYYAYTNDLVNCNLWIFDGTTGTTAYDITAGSYTFIEQPDVPISPGSVNYSWSD